MQETDNGWRSWCIWLAQGLPFFILLIGYYCLKQIYFPIRIPEKRESHNSIEMLDDTQLLSHDAGKKPANLTQSLMPWSIPLIMWAMVTAILNREVASLVNCQWTAERQEIEPPSNLESFYRLHRAVVVLWVFEVPWMTLLLSLYFKASYDSNGRTLLQNARTLCIWMVDGVLLPPLALFFVAYDFPHKFSDGSHATLLAAVAYVSQIAVWMFFTGQTMRKAFKISKLLSDSVAPVPT